MLSTSRNESTGAKVCLTLSLFALSIESAFSRGLTDSITGWETSCEEGMKKKKKEENEGVGSIQEARKNGQSV